MKKRGPVVYTSLQSGEQIKEIEGYPDYFVTSFGRVLSVRALGNTKGAKQTPLREIQLSFGTGRYHYANIFNENGFRHSLRVNRLVYQYFNPKGEPLKEGFVIDHIDHNKINNNITNLRQITHSENTVSYFNHKRKLQQNA